MADNKNKAVKAKEFNRNFIDGVPRENHRPVASHMYDHILLINNYIYYFVVGSERGSPSEPDGNVDVATLAEAMLDQSPSNSVHSNQDQESHDGAQQNLSSLELENKLLKNEVQSLNQEMSSVVNRAKEAETGKLVFTCTLKPQFYW